MTDDEFADELVGRLNNLIRSEAYREDSALEQIRRTLWTESTAWVFTQTINAVVRGGEDHWGGIEAVFYDGVLVRFQRTPEPTSSEAVAR